MFRVFHRVECLNLGAGRVQESVNEGSKGRWHSSFPAFAITMSLKVEPGSCVEPEPMGWIDDLESAERAWEQENVEALDELLNRLSDQRLPSSGDYFRLGQLQFNRGRFADASETLRVGLKGDQGTVRVLTQLAACSLELNQIDEFERFLERAMRLDPFNPMPRKLLVHLNLDQGLYFEAATICRDLLDAFPEDIEVLRILAVCFAHSGETDAEIAIYEEILRLRPDDEEVARIQAACLGEASNAGAEIEGG